MKKLLLVSLLLAGGLFAADANKNKTTAYIGFGTFSGTGTQTWNISSNFGYSYTSDFDYDATSAPISLGFIGATNNRLEISAHTIDIEFPSGNTDTFSVYDLNYDITLESMRTSRLLPYIGFGFGLYNYDNTGYLYEDGKDLKGGAFNLNLGLLYEVSKNIEFEVAYQKKSITWGESYYNYNGYETTVELEEDIKGIYLGLNLKF